jgi:hypothetical protein
MPRNTDWGVDSPEVLRLGFVPGRFRVSEPLAL